MMARSHALLGAAGWLAAAPVVSDAIHQPLDLPALAASTLVCAGAALLPDLDHHDGLIANSLGPPTRLLARGVAAISGGHRHATHSLLFGLLAGGLAWTLVRYAGRPAMLLLALLCAAFALRAVHLSDPVSERRLHWVPVALVAGAITYAEARYVAGTWHWLPMAIAVLDHTNDWTETFVVVPALGVLIFGLAWIHFAAVRTAALTWLDGLAR